MSDPKKKKIVIEPEGDENADWLKVIDDGRFQQDDLAAHDLAQQLHDERTRDEE